MMFKRLCAVALVLILSSCSTGPEPQHLVLRAGGEPSMLNPILSVDGPSTSVNAYIFSGLLKVNADMELEPDLAERYDILDSGKTIRFYLRENVKWHDGVDFTAHDVKFTYDTIADPSTQTVRRSNYIIDGKAVEFRVISDYVIEVRSPKPYAPLLNRLTMSIIPKHIFENEDVNVSEYNRNPIGTGPFKFVLWETSQYLLLKRNDDYYAATPKLEKILLKIIPDNNVALISFEKEEIYSCGLMAKDYERIKAKDRFRTESFYDLMYTYMGFNLMNPFFKEKGVRQAIAMAINKKAIVDGVLKGYGIEAHIPSSPALWTYPETHFKYDYDMQKAKDKLLSLGFKSDPNTGVLHKNGKPFSFKIISNKGNKDREKAAQIIQGNLKELGLDVSLQLMEWSSFISILNNQDHPKSFDAVILGWGLGLDPDNFSTWHSSQYPSGFNFVGYNNPDVDRWLIEGRTTMDREERKKIYANIYNQIAKDVPYVFLYYPKSLIGLSKKLNGLSPAGPSGLFNPIENVSISER